MSDTPSVKNVRINFNKKNKQDTFSKIKKAYEEHDSVKFHINLGDLSVFDLGHVTDILKFSKSMKQHEHKLKGTYLTCEKKHHGIVSGVISKLKIPNIYLREPKKE